MKKLIICLSIAIAALSAQAHNAFQYLATVTNSDGSAYANKGVSVKFDVEDGDGVVLYSETHSTQTDKYGKISLQIGRGDAETGAFNMVDWNKSGLQLRTSIDRGNGYDLSGVQPFGAVPYALHTDVTGGLVGKTADGSFYKLAVDDEGNLSTAKVESNIIPIPEGYSKLVFNEEFNTDGLPDPEKWSYEVGYIRGGEMQYYTEAREENCIIKDGCLNITARNDNYEAAGETHEVTSASIHTRYKHYWTYCRVDVRAKLPACLGSWPAIWMMPNDDVYGYWPNSGEIDIMEHVGFNPDRVHFTAHCLEQTGANNKYYRNIYLPTCYKQFHVYSLIWTKDKLSWLVDDKVKFTVKRTATTWRGWPYNRAFYLILNLAFGGSWGGQQGVDLTQLPITYLVDYVRVYQ